jgi:hypothetical protein
MEVTGQFHAPSHLLLEKEPLVSIYLLGRSLSETLSCSGHCEEEKNHLAPLGIEP